MATELKIDVTHLPDDTSKKTKNGDKIRVHYTGTFVADGSKFDSSVDRNKPFEFTLGSKMVIAGWDEGLLNMSPGEKRTLIIPYSKAYGERGRPPVIPPKADLKFTTELIEIL